VSSTLKKNACRSQPGLRRPPEGDAIDHARRRYLCGSG
jgi:hypothetical protein